MGDVVRLTCDTLVVGAGLVGSAVAMHLAQLGMDGPAGVRTIDFDLEGTLSSSELNAGGVRATWIQPLNIEMSKLTIDYLAAHAEEVGYRACGYLWLHAPDRLEVALAARERQVAAGWPVELWDVAELKRRVPFIDKTDGVAGAAFAPRDGLVNPNLLKNHFRAQARAHGAGFDDRSLLRECRREGTGYVVTCERYDRQPTEAEKLEILSGRATGVPTSRVEYACSRVVNCAGAWASGVARILGYASPAYPMRRQICLFDSREVDLSPFGMVVDTSGVYFHPEATNGMAGFASHNEAHAINFEYDGESFFNEVIWPALYERSTGFERLKHITGWAGLYEVSPDECGIVGPVAGRAQQGLFEAHSFSGHGVMHSYSAGLALAERIINARYDTFDASPLAATRFDEKRFLRETLVI